MEIARKIWKCEQVKTQEGSESKWKAQEARANEGKLKANKQTNKRTIKVR